MAIGEPAGKIATTTAPHAKGNNDGGDEADPRRHQPYGGRRHHRPICDRRRCSGLHYIESTLTEDLDLLISFERNLERPQSGLVALTPVFTHLKKLGYDQFRNEGVLIEGWPVQFLPVADDLDAEALAQSNETEIRIPDAGGAVRTRLLRAEHLVAIALRVGRPKDLLRIAQFIESDAVNFDALRKVLHRHKLSDAWRSFCRRAGISDPLSTRTKR